MAPRKERRIRVVGVFQEEPDLKRLARALIELARLQAEAESRTNDANDLDNGTGSLGGIGETRRSWSEQ